MRITIGRLRAGVLVLAVLLIVAVAGFLGYARYRARGMLRDLPHQLGMKIQQSADGFTYSQSHGGHTLFTLHASKVIQYKDKGRASLHDVSIILYGADGKRADRISGQDFDYDPSSGIAQAQGEVQIYLQYPNRQGRQDRQDRQDRQARQAQSPGTQSRPGDERSQTPAAADKAGSGEGSGVDAPGSIRVKTSGLAFNQKTGQATTIEKVEFQFPQASGKATGASYDSQSGLLVLNHAVEIDSTDSDGNTLVVHASNAQIVRDSHQGFFEQIACEYRGDHISADHATLLFRDDGSAEKLNADGKVHLHTDTGAAVDAKLAVLQLDAHSQPVKADLSGGMAFHSYDALRKINGNAGEGVVTFGFNGALRHATLSNLVSLVNLENGLPGDPGGTATRQVQSERLDVDFLDDPSPRGARDRPQHTGLKAALAQGNAKVAVRTNPTRGSKQDTTIAADRLLADFTGGSSLSMLTGTGHTRLTDKAANGVTQTSAGDNLAIKFVPGRRPVREAKAPNGSRTASRLTAISVGGTSVVGALGAGTSGAGTSTAIESAVQQGNVTMEQSAAPSTAPATVSPRAIGLAAFRATAQKATYTGASQILHLEGSPHATDGALDLVSTTLDYSRTTGDAVANGGVKATYIRAGGGAIGGQLGGYNGVNGKEQGMQQGLLPGLNATHIIAAQATLIRESGDAVFRGQARLWQGTDSIAAPVIELSRIHQTLKAHGETNSAASVSAILTSSGPSQTVGSTGASSVTVKRQATPDRIPERIPERILVRIKSRQMLYSEGERKASFDGGVIAEDGAETMRSDAAEVFLAAATNDANVQGHKGGSPGNAGHPNDPGSAGSLGDSGRPGGWGDSGGSHVEHIVATGHIVLQQQGRKGTGDKLVYGAQDGKFVLTGTPAARPTLSDAQHGTVTGDSLIFNSRDDSVTVSGGSSGTVAHTLSPR